MGVRKSTVCTMARSSVSRYTPASSALSKPTSTFAFSPRGSLPSTVSKTFGLSLAAQPAAFTPAVSFITLFLSRIFAEHIKQRFGVGGRRGAAVQQQRAGVDIVAVEGVVAVVVGPHHCAFQGNAAEQAAR